MEIAKGQIWLALHKQFPSSRQTLRRIGEMCEGDVEKLCSVPESRLVELLGEQRARKLSSFPTVVKDVREKWIELKEQGIKIVPFTDRRYPVRLKRLPKFPPILYMLGNAAILRQSSVAICGSRSTSDAGSKIAENLGLAAAKLGFAVISGYARGVDTAAHIGSVQSNGCIVLVLAEGISRFRIKRAFQGTDDLFERTLVMSQFYPNQTWHVGPAMERNALICGLSDAVAIIEAGPTGGTIAAGRECLAQGKPLWVIDYPGLPATAAGNQTLVGEGGVQLRSVREWIFALYSVLTNSKQGRKVKRPQNAQDQSVLDLGSMPYGPVIDKLEEQIALFESSVGV